MVIRKPRATPADPRAALSIDLPVSPERRRSTRLSSSLNHGERPHHTAAIPSLAGAVAKNAACELVQGRSL
jgi:hypothetical protein